MKIKMNDEWRAKWVAALRSGDYEQTTGQLRDSGGYCCLGVLCEISDEGYWEDDEFAMPGSYRVGDAHDFEHIPAPLAMKVGLCVNTQTALAKLNDNDLLTFAQIADIIERGEFATVELGEDE